MPIPLTLLTGFLGAGKTTLLNRLLHADHGLRVAVLVNDFGAVNIDTQLIVGVEGETISLANGCICCSIRDDLLAAALSLVQRADPPEYLLVETSGVSDPEAVAITFLQPELRAHIALDSILTVVDAEHVLALHGADAVLALDQVALADIVVINKKDVVTPTELARVRAWVRDVSPAARVLETVQAEAPLELLLGVGAFSPERLHQRARREIHVHPQSSAADHDHSHDHDHDHDQSGAHADHTLVYDTWHYRTAAPLEFQALRQAIKALPTTIFRAKGIVQLADVDRRGVLQVVGRRARLVFGEPWGSAQPHTEVVVIGAAGGVEAAALQQAFDACRAGRQTQAEAPVSLAEALEWVRSVFGRPAASPDA